MSLALFCRTRFEQVYDDYDEAELFRHHEQDEEEVFQILRIDPLGLIESRTYCHKTIFGHFDF